MKLLSYAPDIDPIIDGTIIDCNHVIPTVRGIAGAPSPVVADVTANAASAVISAATLIKINGDARTFYGSNTKLYELVSKAYSDVSGSTTYTQVTQGRWRFSQYGDVSLAVSKQNVLRASSSTDFTAVISAASGATSTAPSASVMEVVNDFIFLGDTTGVPGYTADTGDRWVCSAQGDYSDYVPRIAVQCVTGRVTSIPGKITAIKKFGDQVVIYKLRGMYLGTYSGPPIVWSFPELPTSNQGTWCQESVIALGTPEQPLHFFVGTDDFYLFDGARPVPVGAGVKEAFFGTLNTAAADKINLVLDRRLNLVYVYYPIGGSATNNACLAWNYRTKRWGADHRSIKFAFEYSGGSVSYAGLGAYLSNLLGTTATYGNLAPLGLTYGTLATKTSNLLPAFYDENNILYTTTGAAISSTITTHHYGSDGIRAFLQRVTPRWIVKPSDASMDNYYWHGSGDTPVLDTTVQMDGGRFDVMRSAGWHRFSFHFSGPWELSEVGIDAVADGNE